LRTRQFEAIKKTLMFFYSEIKARIHEINESTYFSTMAKKKNTKESKVPAKKPGPELIKAAKKLQVYKKKGGHSQNVRALKRRVQRHNSKMIQLAQGLPSVKVNDALTFASELEKIAKKKDPVEVTEYVKKTINVRLVIGGKGALFKNKNNKLHKYQMHKNSKSLTLKLKDQVLHVDKYDVEWHLYAKSDHILTIKKSGLSHPDSGFGLFAARPYSAGHTIAYYCGHSRATWGESKKDKSDKSMEKENGDSFAAFGSEVFAGAHYCNDPKLHESTKSEAAQNAIVDHKFLLKADTDIEKDEEIFISYYLDYP
jgi:hypothetical protein